MSDGKSSPHKVKVSYIRVQNYSPGLGRYIYMYIYHPDTQSRIIEWLVANPTRPNDWAGGLAEQASGVISRRVRRLP